MRFPDGGARSAGGLASRPGGFETAVWPPGPPDRGRRAPPSATPGVRRRGGFAGLRVAASPRPPGPAPPRVCVGRGRSPLLFQSSAGLGRHPAPSLSGGATLVRGAGPAGALPLRCVTSETGWGPSSVTRGGDPGPRTWTRTPTLLSSPSERPRRRRASRGHAAAGLRGRTGSWFRLPGARGPEAANPTMQCDSRSPSVLPFVLPSVRVGVTSTLGSAAGRG